MSLAAALPRRRRRRWRPPNLREQKAIRRCSWAVVALTIVVIGVNVVFADWRSLVFGSLVWIVIWGLIGADWLRLRFSEPPIVVRYLRTCWTDED